MRAIRLLALAAVLALAGCGGSDDKHEKTAKSKPPTTVKPRPAARFLDTKRVELAIEQSILKQRRIVAHVTCPSRIPLEKGAHFRCTATYKGGSAPFVVTQVDGRGSVRYVGVKK